MSIKYCKRHSPGAQAIAAFEQRSNTYEGAARAFIRGWQVRAFARTEFMVLKNPRDKVSRRF